MKHFSSFILAAALILSASLLISCSKSKDDGGGAPAEKTLNFSVMMSSSMTDPVLYDESQISKELQALASQTLTQTLGGKTTVVVAETEVNTVLDKVKQAFDELAKETNAKHAYPGSYTFAVKCDEKEVIKVTFDTPDIWAITKCENSIDYYTFDGKGPFALESEKNPAAIYQIATTLYITRPNDYRIPVGGDETLLQYFSTVYGDTVVSFTQNLASFLKTANITQGGNYQYTVSYSMHGGEYSASVHCDYLKLTESTNLYLIEDPGISIATKAVDESNTVFQLNMTSGYPFNVDDYTKDIVLNATILEDVDGKDKVVAELPLKVKLVDDPSRSRVAAYKTLDIYKMATPKQGHYKIRVASDWQPGNVEGEIYF